MNDKPANTTDGHSVSPARTGRESRPVEGALQLLALKWCPPVLFTLGAAGPLRFSELKAKLEGIPDNSLTRTLDRMREAGVLDQEVISRTPRKVEYALSDAGNALLPVLDDLEQWAEAHLIRGKPTVLVADQHRRLIDLYTEWLEPEYDVEPAPDWASLETGLDANPDAAVVDPTFPGLDREEDVHRINQQVPTVIAVADPSECPDAKIPADAVVKKPLQAPELTSAVRAALRSE